MRFVQQACPIAAAVAGVAGVAVAAEASLIIGTPAAPTAVVNVLPPDPNDSSGLRVSTVGGAELYQSFTWASDDPLGSVTIFWGREGFNFVGDVTLEVVALDSATNAPTWNVTPGAPLFTGTYAVNQAAVLPQFTTFKFDVGSLPLVNGGLYGLELSSPGNFIIATRENEDAYGGGIGARLLSTGLNNFPNDWAMQLQAVPEPASAMTLGLALGLLAHRRR